MKNGKEIQRENHKGKKPTKTYRETVVDETCEGVQPNPKYYHTPNIPRFQGEIPEGTPEKPTQNMTLQKDEFFNEAWINSTFKFVN